MHIVMTGGTSGFGAVAADELARAGHAVSLGARNPAVSDLPPETVHLPLELSDLASVDGFASRVQTGPKIDALVLNAGIQLAAPESTVSGIERTFFVNHLAHLRLLTRLLDLLPGGARVILTGSGTHDPAEGTPVTPPVHADARRLAFPSEDPTLPKSKRNQVFRAYSSSKLANIMTARHLATLRPDLSVMAYDPGYVPWTGLGRANGRVLSAIASLVLPRFIAKDRTSTVALSGHYLASLARDERFAGQKGTYWSVRNPELVAIEPSVLARDEQAAASLWSDSLDLLALTGTAAR